MTLPPLVLRSMYSVTDNTHQMWEVCEQSVCFRAAEVPRSASLSQTGGINKPLLVYRNYLRACGAAAAPPLCWKHRGLR